MKSPVPEAEAAYRGFLFSDLRGYTAYVERHGNQAAAGLLDAYRELIREVVARHRGAEIRTEGDSFYVVFPSAQRAVTCGLDIVAAAARHNEANLEAPIRVGVGIHAGETIERPDGYIGSAVNVAARVCARARAGEVLVSATVRELTRSAIPVSFTARGSHRLKGIAEPVALFAARPVSTSPAITRPTRALLVVPVVTIAAFVVGWVMLQAIRPDAGASATQAASASVKIPSPSIRVPASPNPSAMATFAAAAEAALLGRLEDSIARHCRRADPADVPVLEELSARVSTPLIHDAGLECRLGSSSEPDTVWYWRTIPGQRLEQTSSIFFQTVGRHAIPPGDCATADYAYGRWEFGQVKGRLLCYGSRNATLVWTYDDENILATAIRSDGDMRTLYSWWRDHARLLGS